MTPIVDTNLKLCSRAVIAMLFVSLPARAEDVRLAQPVTSSPGIPVALAQKSIKQLLPHLAKCVLKPPITAKPYDDRAEIEIRVEHMSQTPQVREVRGALEKECVEKATEAIS